MIYTDELRELQEKIVNAVPVERLYLFGSYATGSQNEDSDYDFYVVLPNDGL
jgi:predicted nucleotidyltransferase